MTLKTRSTGRTVGYIPRAAQIRIDQRSREIHGRRAALDRARRVARNVNRAWEQDQRGPA
jgi:hypothetical protein